VRPTESARAGVAEPAATAVAPASAAAGAEPAATEPEPAARPAGQTSGAVSHEADPLRVDGPGMCLRYATRDDAERLFELGRDPAVTRFFSWGPYRQLDEPIAYIDALAAKRAGGVLLEFVVDHHRDGVVGVTGLSELSPRDRRATVGSWFGHRFWGSGVNRESKALVTHLAFATLGMDRLTAWANTRNGRSQTALERVGFRREGILTSWHRHGDQVHDVVVYAMLRAGWARSGLQAVPVEVRGTPPPAFVVA
jgi:[ribosomal protein S5]-alanine N-acetyltransferase